MLSVKIQPLESLHPSKPKAQRFLFPQPFLLEIFPSRLKQRAIVCQFPITNDVWSKMSSNPSYQTVPAVLTCSEALLYSANEGLNFLGV